MHLEIPYSFHMKDDKAEIDELMSFLKLIREVRKTLKHIKKPFTEKEIYEQYLSGEYNSELLLQHLLIHFTKD
jgi:hypothetical protein